MPDGGELPPPGSDYTGTNDSGRPYAGGPYQFNGGSTNGGATPPSQDGPGGQPRIPAQRGSVRRDAHAVSAAMRSYQLGLMQGRAGTATTFRSPVADYPTADSTRRA